MFVMNNKWDIKTSPEIGDEEMLTTSSTATGASHTQPSSKSSELGHSLVSVDEDDLPCADLTLDPSDSLIPPEDQPESSANKLASATQSQVSFGDRDPELDEEEFDNFNGTFASLNLQPQQVRPGHKDVSPTRNVVFDRKLNHFINTISSSKIPLIVPKCFDVPMLSIPNLRIMKSNDHTISLQTIIRNKNSARDDFVFNADRLIRLVIEEGLNQLPFNEKEVTTPTGEVYRGVEYLKSNCGVSIVRSGEAMEKGLRDCCRSIRIGKVLIQSDEETHQARVLYAKLPADISLRKVLLLYPIMSTGNTVIKAVKVLMKNGVKESNIVLINLFSTPMAIRAVASRFQQLTIQTTEVHPIAPFNFGQKYFGTF